MTVATFTQPNYLTQSASAYKAALDAAIAVLQTIGGDFAPHAQSSPNMQVVIDAGRIFKPGGTMVSVTQQITGALIAPVSNPRIDRIVVDSENGVYSVLTGAEAATPTAPTIPNGKLPVCQINMTVGMTTIANSIITDERTTYSPLARLMRMPVEQVQSATTGFTREILLTDRGILFDCDCSNGPINIILPDSAQAGNGFMIGVMKSDAVANSITLTPGITGETFNDGSATKQISVQNGVVIITTDGLGQWYLAFDSSRTYDNVTLTGDTTISGNLSISGGLGPSLARNYSLSASCASNALTIEMKGFSGGDLSSQNKAQFSFRSSVESNGTHDILDVSENKSLTISSGSTLGLLASQYTRIWILGINDAGVFRLGAITCSYIDSSGSRILSIMDDTLMSVTAEGGSGGADNLHVLYADSASASSPIRVLGYLETSQSTPGTWVTNPIKVQLWQPGMKLPGDLIRRISAQSSTMSQTTNTIPRDDTLPLNTEGASITSIAISPLNRANILKVGFHGFIGATALSHASLAIFRDGTAVAATAASVTGSAYAHDINSEYEGLSNTLGSITFEFRHGASAGTINMGGTSGSRLFGGVPCWRAFVEELMT